ncbi:MAG: FapA family protein [Negativicutes bacterium]|nr:FapA family protein [Negativicutes bacterium]
MAGQDNLLDSLLNPGGVADGLAGDAVIAETGDYRLWIDSDKLKLQLLVRKKYLPETGECVERSEQEAAFLAEAIHQQIERAGVVGQPTGWGEKIWQALENPDLPVVVVSGTPPVEGEDGQVVIHFRLEADRRPQAEENEKIDYRELSPFVIASADDLLADIIPPTEGIAGQDVFGQILPAKPGKPAKIGLGDNVRCQDNKVYAEITGQVALIDDKINVSPILVISEDVDYETGNINFTGSVLVRGAVQPGFTVTASGSVEVDGSVAGAVVAGNEVVLLRGVNGGKITAKKSVRAKFIENAEVTAGEDIFVSDYIMHSTVRAGRKIVVVEGKGLIVGGVVMAGEELEIVAITLREGSDAH